MFMCEETSLLDWYTFSEDGDELEAAGVRTYDGWF
jgi:hypothetical protein